MRSRKREREKSGRNIFHKNLDEQRQKKRELVEKRRRWRKRKDQEKKEKKQGIETKMENGEKDGKIVGENKRDGEKDGGK